MAVHQHGQQAAVHQIRPAAVLLLRKMSGDHMDLVLVPVALDVQPIGVGAAAAETHAVGRHQVLKSYGCHGCIPLNSYSVASLTAIALQDLMSPHGGCFGCGGATPDGLPA